MPKQKNLHIDLETYSEANLPKCGGHYYARHPTTRVLLLAYAYGDDEPRIVDLEHGEEIPETLLRGLVDPTVVKWAHNAAFERAVLRHALGVPCDPDQWRCTMVWAMSLSLPAGLDKLSEVLKLGDAAKNADGKRLIRKFCTPGGNAQLAIDDGDWRRFREYCLQDVRAEQAVANRLSRYALPAFEWAAWATDQRVNDTGLPIDTELVRAVLGVAKTHLESALAEAVQTTQLANPNSREQALGWLSQRGVAADDMQGGTVDALLSGPLPEDVRRFLECRQQTSRASLSKFDALERAVCDDGRLRGAFQFAGAGRTGRFAGRIFQPQNLPRPTIPEDDIDAARRIVRTADAPTMALLYDDVSGVLSSLVRSVIAAPSGKKLVVADYSSIESVMIAWCARSEYLLKLYHDGLDPYKDFATKLYGCRYEDVTKQQRTFCKPAVLGAGYGMSAGGLKKYAEAFGMAMDDREASRQIDTFRKAYSDIPAFWQTLDDAVREAMGRKREPVTAGRFRLCFDGKFLTIQLPVGRSLYYYQPRLEPNAWGRPELTYMGREPGVRIGTHPGKIVENLVQAVARDLLVQGLRNVEAAGFEVVGHVHDEIIALADENDDGAVGRLVAAMTAAPDWCKDAPVRADGYEAPYYRKD